MLDCEKICKFCGSTEDAFLYNVFEPFEEFNGYSETLPSRIKDSLQIEVVPGDVICHKCLYSVNSFYRFKESTTQTYKSLHKAVAELRPTPDNKTDVDDANEEVQILEEKIQEHPMVELPKQQLPASPVIVSKAPGTVVMGIPGSSGTSKNSTNQRARVNNNEPARKGKRHLPSPTKSASNHLKCHEEQHPASLDFRDELIVVNNALVPDKEAMFSVGKCYVCLKMFTNTYSLKRHLTTHSSIRPFVCKECGKSFKDPSYLVKHEQVHSRQSKPLACKYCDLPFSLKTNLQRHMKNVHFIESKSDSDVEVTAEVVATNSVRELSPPPEEPLVVEEGPVICRLCLSSFRDVEGLNEHKIVHNKELFQCDECDQTFSNSSNFEKHRKEVHAVCEICHRPKYSDCSCESKRKRTRGQLICPTCSKSFPDTFILVMHCRGCKKGQKIDEKEIVLID